MHSSHLPHVMISRISLLPLNNEFKTSCGFGVPRSVLLTFLQIPSQMILLTSEVLTCASLQGKGVSSLPHKAIEVVFCIEIKKRQRVNIKFGDGSVQSALSCSHKGFELCLTAYHRSQPALGAGASV
jgi:hypothetical protein